MYVAHGTSTSLRLLTHLFSLLMIFHALAMYSGTCGLYIVRVLSPQTTISYLTTRRYYVSMELRLLGAAIETYRDAFLIYSLALVQKYVPCSIVAKNTAKVRAELTTKHVTFCASIRVSIVWSVQLYNL